MIELALAKDSILSEKEKNKMLSEELDILKLLISDSFGKLNNTASDLDTKMITIEKFEKLKCHLRVILTH